MKTINKAEVYKAMTNLFTLKWDVNLKNLDIIMEYFHDELVEDYNTLPPVEWEYNGSDFNPRFDQWAVDRITYLFQQ